VKISAKLKRDKLKLLSNWLMRHGITDGQIAVLILLIVILLQTINFLSLFRFYNPH